MATFDFGPLLCNQNSVENKELLRVIAPLVRFATPVEISAYIVLQGNYIKMGITRQDVSHLPELDFLATRTANNKVELAFLQIDLPPLGNFERPVKGIYHDAKTEVDYLIHCDLGQRDGMPRATPLEKVERYQSSRKLY